ncbi:MAG: hypothetical protein HQK53_10065 [Oligoflexia bacterium]|nr:hypothetical protein [Oligoflexia bacterium]
MNSLRKLLLKEMAEIVQERPQLLHDFDKDSAMKEELFSELLQTFRQKMVADQELIKLLDALDLADSTDKSSVVSPVTALKNVILNLILIATQTYLQQLFGINTFIHEFVGHVATGGGILYYFPDGIKLVLDHKSTNSTLADKGILDNNVSIITISQQFHRISCRQ